MRVSAFTPPFTLLLAWTQRAWDGCFAARTQQQRSSVFVACLSSAPRRFGCRSALSRASRSYAPRRSTRLSCASTARLQVRCAPPRHRQSVRAPCSAAGMDRARPEARDGAGTPYLPMKRAKSACPRPRAAARSLTRRARRMRPVPPPHAAPRDSLSRRRAAGRQLDAVASQRRRLHAAHEPARCASALPAKRCSIERPCAEHCCALTRRLRRAFSRPAQLM